MATRVIKKYPNRRLYDTVDSKYITVDGIRELIVAGTDLRIIEETSGNDITRSILLQVLTQQEQAGRPVLSDRALTQLIRYYGHPLQSFMGAYVDKSLDAFTEQQSMLEENLNNVMGDSPAIAMQKAFQEMSTSGVKSWNSMQQAFFEQLTGVNRTSSTTDSEKKK